MKINGELFKLIRISRDLSQTELASILNIKQQIISELENTGECSQELLYKISQVLRFTPKFFLKEPLPKDTNLILYRKKLTIPKKFLNSIDARLGIFLNYQLPELFKQRVNVISMPSKINQLIIKLSSLNTIEEKTSYLRETFNIKMQVSNLAELIESLGIIIIYFNFSTDKIDGFSTILNGKFLIIVNKMFPIDRLRFTLAHELGHICLDHLSKSSEIMSENYEKEANQFASELLIPSTKIKPLLKDLTITKLFDLKRTWKVSVGALVKKAIELNMVKNSTSLYVQLARIGCTNKNEPDIINEKEYPSSLKKLIENYKEQNQKTDFHLVHEAFGYMDQSEYLFLTST